MAKEKMTQEETNEYLDGKIAGLELALEALIRNRLYDDGRTKFAEFLFALSAEQAEQISPVTTPRFRAGLTEALEHLSTSLLRDKIGGAR